MTTINDISDFARIIREQPEWADTIRSLLLGKELLELPVRFAEFVELTNRNFQLVYERLERLETGMDEVKADVGEVKERLGGLEVRVSGLEASVSGLETSVSGLETSVSGLESSVSSLRADMNILKGRSDNAVGPNYEGKVTKSIGGIIGPLYRRVRIQKGLLIGPNPEFTDVIEDAEANDLISQEQFQEIHELDLVLTGRRKSDGAEVYIAAEISITIGDSDITRAARRAEMLAAAVGLPVEPVVIGSQIDDARTALAAANKVSVFLAPEN